MTFCRSDRHPHGLVHLGEVGLGSVQDDVRGNRSQDLLRIVGNDDSEVDA